MKENFTLLSHGTNRYKHNATRYIIGAVSKNKYSKLYEDLFIVIK